MKGYKVFNPDWTCRGYQFEVGKIFTEDVSPVCCDKGFHFCTKIEDCFNYYSFDSHNKVAEIEALGDIDTNKDGSKCSTNKIYIIRELTWYEVLDLVNTGEACTGLCNSGDNNSGNFNSGHCNSGSKNSGSCNSGDRNIGGKNSGHYNIGNFNSGDYNSGDSNSGDKNSGARNSGNNNIGNFNSGDWNKADFSNGCFNTKLPRIFLFDKPSDWTFSDWLSSEARYILMGCPINAPAWVWWHSMSKEEKRRHPEYSTTGGFLANVKGEKERQLWWDGLPEKDKRVVVSLPNFDRDIFKEITGIDVRVEEL